MTERQLMLVQDLRPEVISCTPSYALTLAQAFHDRGVGPDDISLRYAVLGAEPWTERMREEIDAGLGVRSTNIYGLSEIVGPGVSSECVEERSGSHVNEDHFLPEIVDPETREPVAEGEEGVLVITTLTKQALPLVRYWTGDICNLSSEPCPCGRTLVRRLGTLDEVEVLVEVNEDVVASLTDARRSELASRTSALIKATIGSTMEVTIVPPGGAPRSEGGKIQRVRDLR
jgi:phenylacetate-CoA ligase